MQNNGTAVLDRPEVTLASPLDALSREELMVAFGASDMPNRIRGGFPHAAQLAAWAEQGLARKGAEYVRLAGAVTLALNIRHAMGTITAAESRIFRSVWPSIQRCDTANDCGWELRPIPGAGSVVTAR
jgi:hypothetical protein